MWFIKALTAIGFLFLIIFTIPLTFDVGGRTAGLGFSLALSTYYFFYSILLLGTPRRSRFRWALGQIVRYTQWIAILALMIWSLNKFSVDSDGPNRSWIERTFSFTRANDVSLWEWIFGKGGQLENNMIGGWDVLLRWSTPAFQILEGFCSLIVIQACGQITKWLANSERGEAWMIGLLSLSAGIFSSSIYFLWRISTFPDLDNVDAILIGGALACAMILAGWGIVSGRGNPVESSLFFAYITLCIYQIFTDYQPSNPKRSATPPQQPALPPLPPIILASLTTVMSALSTLPSTVHTGFNFLVAAVSTITPSVIVSLTYRVFVMYAFARIIPVIRESGARALSQEPSLEDNDQASRFLGFLSWFSPSILIAVYTSLLMQHFASNPDNGAGNPQDWWTSQGGDTGGNISRWVNLAFTMSLYAVELYIQRDEDDSSLTLHWKTE